MSLNSKDKCDKCEKPITWNVANYSMNRFGLMLCIPCQKVQRHKEAKTPAERKLADYMDKY